MLNLQSAYDLMDIEIMTQPPEGFESLPPISSKMSINLVNAAYHAKIDAYLNAHPQVKDIHGYYDCTMINYRDGTHKAVWPEPMFMDAFNDVVNLVEKECSI